MKQVDMRIAALRRFAVAITVISLLGHTILGFETSWAQMITSLLTAYLLELALEWIQARAQKRPVRFGHGFESLANFLLPAHITGLAVGMLLYSSDRLLPFAFAAAVGIGSKAIFKLPADLGSRHFMNPSNFGLAVTYLALPDIAATVVPYQYTTELTNFGDLALPMIAVCTGSILNTHYTKRIPLVLSWVVGFILQAYVRHMLFGESLFPSLAPMTGMAFFLFTFYMVSDPGTTPSEPRKQIAFGASVALAYGILMALHTTFVVFFALAVVCIVRGVGIHVLSTVAKRRAALVLALKPAAEAIPAIATLGGSNEVIQPEFTLAAPAAKTTVSL